ncbi:MAG TPA: hypothetical protein PK307_17830 [Spirochaetota bacterium]|nr:hypothetical protein [Spirochaetota bacterium]HQL84063.1 hypothetical protein [Spirochaetota bacterium]
MAWVMMAIVFVVLFSAPSFSCTVIQKYMFFPNSSASEKWGFGKVVV